MGTCPGMPDDTAVSCSKMAEPIEMPFLLWTRVGQRKHALHDGAHYRHLANTIELFIFCGRAKTAELIEMPFGLWTRVGPRKHVLGGVHTGATWLIRFH